MQEVIFTVLGNPQGKARPRFSKGHAYTPSTTAEYEKRVRTAFLAHAEDWQKSGAPLGIDITAFFGVPKSYSKRKTAETYGRAACKKPDADNIAKVIMDSLNGVAYGDDVQIIELNVAKSFIQPGQEACINVRIYELEEE